MQAGGEGAFVWHRLDCWLPAPGLGMGGARPAEYSSPSPRGKIREAWTPIGDAIWVAGAIQRGWPIAIMSLVFILEDDRPSRALRSHTEVGVTFPEPFMRWVLCLELYTHKLFKLPTALGHRGGQAFHLTDHETGSERFGIALTNITQVTRSRVVTGTRH